MNVYEPINKLLNELINRSDLTARITNLSNELLGTLKNIENCIGCKNYYSYYNEVYESINKIKNYLVELEKGERKEQDVIYKLNNELIKIDVEINGYALCEACGVKHMMGKLTNLLNELINRNDLTVEITG